MLLVGGGSPLETRNSSPSLWAHICLSYFDYPVAPTGSRACRDWGLGIWGLCNIPCFSSHVELGHLPAWGIPVLWDPFQRASMTCMAHPPGQPTGNRDQLCLSYPSSSPLPEWSTCLLS